MRPRVRPPSEVPFDLLEEKWKDFTHFQVWPLRSKLDPEGWLGNFNDDDRPFAYHLLNSFMYFSEAITNQLFEAAVQHLSQLIAQTLDDTTKLRDRWNAFLSEVVVTYVTGEDPHPTDSGYMFSRKARDLIAIPEERILNPEVALARAAEGCPEPILFVDDFVGSGNQFRDTWHRRYEAGGANTSFAALAASSSLPPAFYCPPICTQAGLDNIRNCCPEVTVSAGNILAENYSVFHPQSVVWPSEFRESGAAFVRRISEKLGIPDDNSEWDYRGFRHLGLALAFAHKTPDATIPLFRWNRGGWKPLVTEG